MDCGGTRLRHIALDECFAPVILRPDAGKIELRGRFEVERIPPDPIGKSVLSHFQSKPRLS